MADDQTMSLMQCYLASILEANKVTNLTRITDGEQARLLHIEDSLVGLPEVNEAPDGLYGDLGSGGGFPGVPLALATGRTTLLVDSVKKKMAIVQSVLDDLSLSEQIFTSSERIEDLPLEYKEKFAVLTARALSKLVSLIELASPLLKKGGRLLQFSSTKDDEDISINPAYFYRNELQYYTSYCQVHQFGRAVDAMDTGKVKTDRLITRLYPLEEFPQAIEDVLDHNVLKLVIRPNGMED